MALARRTAAPLLERAGLDGLFARSGLEFKRQVLGRRELQGAAGFLSGLTAAGKGS